MNPGRMSSRTFMNKALLHLHTSGFSSAERVSGLIERACCHILNFLV
ncbi:MAG: hypothetical protein V4662_22995 [Verrucomicrobiota bacterium]